MQVRRFFIEIITNMVIKDMRPNEHWALSVKADSLTNDIR